MLGGSILTGECWVKGYWQASAGWKDTDRGILGGKILTGNVGW